MVSANIIAEQSVIGAIVLQSDKTMPVATLELSEDDFYVPELRNIYSACKKLFMGGKGIDFATLVSVLGKQYAETLRVAAETTPSIGNFQSYVEAVKKQSQKIKAYEKAMGLVQALDDNSEEESSFQSRAADILGCFDDTKKDDTVSFKQGVLDFIDRQNKPINYISTGFERLDRMTYIDRGDFIIMGGRPSAGKTAFTLQMMLNMGKHYHVAYFSLETKTEKMYDRIIASDDEADFDRIKRHALTDEEWQRVTKNFDYQSKENVDVIKAAGYSVPQIKSKALQLKADIIFIDYLTLIRAHGNSLYERATNISMELHTLAQTTNMTVVALSQLNRAGKSEPDMTSLRESGQIEQDADIVMMLDYDQSKPDSRELWIVKNKEGRVGHGPVAFDGAHQKFSEVETRYE